MANGDPAPQDWYICPDCREPLGGAGEFCPFHGVLGVVFEYTHREGQLK